MGVVREDTAIFYFLMFPNDRRWDSAEVSLPHSWNESFSNRYMYLPGLLFFGGGSSQQTLILYLIWTGLTRSLLLLAFYYEFHCGNEKDEPELPSTD